MEVASETDIFKEATYGACRTFSVSQLAYAGPGEAISDQLVIDADIAMYQAKRKGGDRHQIIDLREANATNERNTLESDLRIAVANNQLDVAYQPIVSVADGLVIGVEALLRWTNKDRGPVSPGLMVAVAEQSGIINKIGEWILRQSCHDRARWLQQYPNAPLSLSVNVSPHQLMRQGFCDLIKTVLTETETDPAALVLEVTENIFVEDNDRAMMILTDLRDLGLQLAMDDFGTGYSSLSYLHRLPIQIVKIDQSFVANMDVDSSLGSIIDAIASLSHVLGFTVCAEGVETQSQHEGITHIGCDTAQGYFYARPMAADDITQLLASLPTSPLHLPELEADPHIQVKSQ